MTMQFGLFPLLGDKTEDRIKGQDITQEDIQGMGEGIEEADWIANPTDACYAYANERPGDGISHVLWTKVLENAEAGSVSIFLMAGMRDGLLLLKRIHEAPAAKRDKMVAAIKEVVFMGGAGVVGSGEDVAFSMDAFKKDGSFKTTGSAISDNWNFDTWASKCIVHLLTSSDEMRPTLRFVSKWQGYRSKSSLLTYSKMQGVSQKGRPAGQALLMNSIAHRRFGTLHGLWAKVAAVGGQARMDAPPFKNDWFKFLAFDASHKWGVKAEEEPFPGKQDTACDDAQAIGETEGDKLTGVTEAQCQALCVFSPLTKGIGVKGCTAFHYEDGVCRFSNEKVLKAPYKLTEAPSEENAIPLKTTKACQDICEHWSHGEGPTECQYVAVKEEAVKDSYLIDCKFYAGEPRIDPETGDWQDWQTPKCKEVTEEGWTLYEYYFHDLDLAVKKRRACERDTITNVIAGDFKTKKTNDDICIHFALERLLGYLKTSGTVVEYDPITLLTSIETVRDCVFGTTKELFGEPGLDGKWYDGLPGNLAYTVGGQNIFVHGHQGPPFTPENSASANPNTADCYFCMVGISLDFPEYIIGNGVEPSSCKRCYTDSGTGEIRPQCMFLKDYETAAEKYFAPLAGFVEVDVRRVSVDEKANVDEVVMGGEDTVNIVRKD